MYPLSANDREILTKLHLLNVRVIRMRNHFVPLWISLVDGKYGAWGFTTLNLEDILNTAVNNRPTHGSFALFELSVLDEPHRQKHGYEWVT